MFKLNELEAEKWLKWFLNLSSYCRKYGRFDVLASQIVKHWREVDEAFYVLADEKYRFFIKELFTFIAETVKGDLNVRAAVLKTITEAHKDVPVEEFSKLSKMSDDGRVKYAEKVIKYVRGVAEKHGSPYGGVAALKWLMSPTGQAFIPFLWKEKYKVLCVNAFVELIVLMFS